eukprot:SAG31_NODE_1101_length_9905_cov_3.367122_3_plen_386_part_00
MNVGTFGIKAEAGLLMETKRLAAQLGWLVELGRAQEPPRITELLPCYGIELNSEYDIVDAVIQARWRRMHAPNSADESEESQTFQERRSTTAKNVDQNETRSEPPPVVYRCLKTLVLYKGPKIDPKNDKQKLAELEEDALVRVLDSRPADGGAVLAKIAVVHVPPDEAVGGSMEAIEEQQLEPESVGQGVDEALIISAESADKYGDVPGAGRDHSLAKPTKGQEPHYVGAPNGEPELVGWVEMVGPEKKGKKKTIPGKPALGHRQFFFQWENASAVGSQVFKHAVNARHEVTGLDPIVLAEPLNNWDARAGAALVGAADAGVDPDHPLVVAAMRVRAKFEPERALAIQLVEAAQEAEQRRREKAEAKKRKGSKKGGGASKKGEKK